MTTKGQYIVIEGMDGAGKTTAMSAVTSFLVSQGIKFEVVREPGFTVLAEEIREVVKRPRLDTVDPRAELLLFGAARADSYARIKTMLDNGITVVSDRSAVSTYAYQGAGRGLYREVDKLREIVFGDDVPYDYGIFLLVDPLVGLARSRGRGELDRLEQEPLDFFKRVASAYDNAAEHRKYCKSTLYLHVSDVSISRVEERLQDQLAVRYKYLNKE